jgi:hypothetical protein
MASRDYENQSQPESNIKHLMQFNSFQCLGFENAKNFGAQYKRITK